MGYNDRAALDLVCFPAMDWLKGIGGKILTAALVLGVAVAGYGWYEAGPETRSLILSSVGKIIGWLLAVILIPWASFLVIGWVARKDSNAAGVVLVGLMTIIEAVGLWWLFDFSITGGAAWSMAIAAVLLAAVYNVFTCDWIAEKVE